MNIKTSWKSTENLVIGTGAAGLNTALLLQQRGAGLLVATNDLRWGTSRNTGSDKQTYYKLGLSGTQDSVDQLAETLFQGGAMDGPTAMAEAALSSRAFYHLIDLGVPFPQDDYGRMPGYKTDHDPACRASSCGPYTSKLMTEALEEQVKALHVPVLEGLQLLRLLHEGDTVKGALFLDCKAAQRGEVHLVGILAGNTFLAVGASGSIYRRSVDPPTQWGGIGTAILAGAQVANITQWQYGMASLHPRWNVSGSYQQVLPAYYSEDSRGNRYDFLPESFQNSADMLKAIFLKGYQWPFDAAKANGSSRVDMAVSWEIAKGRKVYLDYTHNPMGWSFDKILASLDAEAKDYLIQCRALQETPYLRLETMNAPAARFYREHGRDLKKEPLEIAVCAQHMNGGLAVDHHWQTSLEHLYAVGECAGTHGIRRPGGAALNSGQVGGFRAVQEALFRETSVPLCSEMLREQMEETVHRCERYLECDGEKPAFLWNRIRERMDTMAFLRSEKVADSICSAAEQDRLALSRGYGARHPKELQVLFACEDHLMVQETMAYAVKNAIRQGGGSQGSAIVKEEDGTYRPAEAFREDQVQLTFWKDGQCQVIWRPVLPLPNEHPWFETAWAKWREKLEKKSQNQL